MFSWTRVCLSVPSMAAVSILGWFPQSAQYMVLRQSKHFFLKLDNNLQKSQDRNHLLYMLHNRHLLPSLWIHHNGVRLVYHARDECLAVLAGHLSHFDDIPTRISPVKVSGHPVHGDTPRHLQLHDLRRRRTDSFTVDGRASIDVDGFKRFYFICLSKKYCNKYSSLDFIQ